MYKTDAVKFFKRKKNVAAAAGVSCAAVSAWGEIIPEGRAARLEKASNGALKYDSEIYKSLKRGNKNK